MHNIANMNILFIYYLQLYDPSIKSAFPILILSITSKTNLAWYIHCMHGHISKQHISIFSWDAT